MSKTLVVSIPRAQLAAKSARTTSVISVPAKQRPKRSQARPPRAPGRAAPAAAFLRAYTNTLNDPFEYAGVPLGYDCFLPTTQAAAFIRRSVIVNATDGSFSLSLQPDALNMVTEFNGLNSVGRGGAVTVPAQNQVNLAANFAESRVVSGGIRCFALFAETTAPGVLFAGTTPDYGRGNFNALSTNGLTALSGSRIGIGSRGVTATIRPYDNGSFEFFSFPILGYNSATIPYMTSAYIAGLGFPVGTVIWYEAILNMELIALSSANSAAEPSDEVAPPSASSWFPTPGSLWTAAQTALSPPIVLDAVTAGTQVLMGNYAGAARTAARSALGAGRNFNAFSQRRSRENTIMYEEMKEDQGGYSLTRRTRG